MPELTARHLRIPKALARHLGNKGATDEEEIESACWLALGKGFLAFDPVRMPPRAGQSEDDALGVYLIVCCRRAILSHLRHKTAACRCPPGVMNRLEGNDDPSCNGRSYDHYNGHDQGLTLLDLIDHDNRTGRGIPRPTPLEAQEVLQTVLGALNPDDQRVLLWHAEGLNQVQIGERLGVTPARIGQRLVRIHKTACALREEGLV